jgi:hypothetical protein
MLRSMNRLTVVATLVVMGCSASGPRYQPAAMISPDFATVYVYRPNSPFQKGFSPDVYLNGRRAFPIVNSGYGVLTIAPGAHEIEVRYDSSAMAIEAERRYGSRAASSCLKRVTQKISVDAGQDYYVRYAMPEPLRPEPSSGALLLLGPVGVGASVIRKNTWLEEMCDLPLRFGVVSKEVGTKEISKTKLVESTPLENAPPDSAAPAIR